MRQAMRLRMRMPAFTRTYDVISLSRDRCAQTSAKYTESVSTTERMRLCSFQCKCMESRSGGERHRVKEESTGMESQRTSQDVALATTQDATHIAVIHVTSRFRQIRIGETHVSHETSNFETQSGVSEASVASRMMEGMVWRVPRARCGQ